MNIIYLDHAASTPMDQDALELFCQTAKKDFCNSSSSHMWGRDQNKKIELVRHLLHDILQTPQKEYEVVFTGSATESNNWVIENLMRAFSNYEVLSSNSYHPSLTEPVRQYSQRYQWKSKEIIFTNGRLDEEDLISQINENVKLLILLWVNNSSGLIIDVENLSRKIKERFPRIHIHVDGVQGFGKFPLSLENGSIDSLTVNGHKMGGPKGVAALVFRKECHLQPMLLGGGHENGWRSSTLNGVAVIAWGKAIENSYSQMRERRKQVEELWFLFKKTLKDKCSRVEFPLINDSPYIGNVVFPGIASDLLLRHVERQGVLLSASSACSSRGKKKISLVYEALDLKEQWHSEVIRVSLSPFTNQEEILRAVDVLVQEYLQLCRLLRV